MPFSTLEIKYSHLYYYSSQLVLFGACDPKSLNTLRVGKWEVLNIDDIRRAQTYITLVITSPAQPKSLGNESKGHYILDGQN